MKDYERWVDIQIKDLKLRSLLDQNMQNVPKKLMKKVKKANSNAKNDKGESLLVCVVKYISSDLQQVKHLNFLLRDGADPDVQDKKNRTPLMYCCIENKPAAANILINNTTTSLKVKDKLGNTALMYAALHGMVYTVSCLVDRLTRQWGWDVLRQTNVMGYTAEHLAKKNQHVKVTITTFRGAVSWKRKSLGKKDRFIDIQKLLYQDFDILEYTSTKMPMRRTRTFSEGFIETKLRKSTKMSVSISFGGLALTNTSRENNS